ncbi:hypothetical protein BH09SUM1_BH09SUM1_23380 [soil metagenome]
MILREKFDAMNERERRLVLAAAALLGAFVLWFGIVRPIAGRFGGGRSTSGLSSVVADVRRTVELDRTLTARMEEASVKIPSSKPDGQVQEFIAKIESVSGANQFKIKTFGPHSGTAAKAPAPGGRVGFDLSGNTTHGGLVKFITALSTEGLPYRIESMEVKGNLQQPDALEVTFELSLIILEAMGSEKKV